MSIHFRKKAAPKARTKSLDIMGIEELASFFNQTHTHWNTKEQLEQYSKSLYVFAAVNKISTKISSVDLQLFKITSKNGDSKEVLSHPILDLMYKINPFQTKSEFLRTAWINKKLTGEAFWLKVRNKQGEVVELWNLRPDMMLVNQDENSYIKDYTFRRFDGTEIHFSVEDIVFFKDPDPLNPLRGQSPIGAAKYRIITEHEATRYQKDFFKNNARPDALLVTADSLDEDQRKQMTSAWDEEHQGSDNAGRIGILEGGMKYQQVSISQKEMDYIESLKFTRGDILVALGVPESVIFSNASNFATAESDFRAFLTETIVPEMTQLCEVLNEMLVVPDFGEQWYLDFRDPAIEDRSALRADNIAGFGKWITVNEIRSTLNLPPIEGGDVIASGQGVPDSNMPASVAGDLNPTKALEISRRREKTLRIMKGRRNLRLMFDIQVSLKDGVEKFMKDSRTPKKKVVSKKKSGPSKYEKVSLLGDEELRRNYFDLVNKRIDTRSRKFKNKLGELFLDQRDRAIGNLSNAKKKHDMSIEKFAISDVLDLKKEVKIFSTVGLPFLIEYAQQGGNDAARLTGEEFSMTDALKTAMNERSQFFAESVNDTQFQRLEKTLVEGINNNESIADLSARVHDVYDSLPDWKAEQIARTETTYATNSGMVEQFNDSGVADGKEWVAVMDTRTRDSHATINGEIVATDGLFSNKMRFPGDSADPSEVINCRCVIAPTVGPAKMLKGGPGSGGARDGAGRKPGSGTGGPVSQKLVDISQVPDKYVDKFKSVAENAEKNGLPIEALSGLESIQVKTQVEMAKLMPTAASEWGAASGIYDAKTKTLYFNSSNLSEDFPRPGRLALVHEIGHHVMESQMDAGMKSKVFDAFKKGGVDGLGEYANKNHHERFAEAFKYYMDGPRGNSMVKNIDPDIYNIISDHFNK